MKMMLMQRERAQFIEDANYLSMRLLQIAMPACPRWEMLEERGALGCEALD